MSDEGDLFGLSVMGFFVGLWLFYKGFVWFKQRRLIEETPTSKIRSLAMGLVEIYGKAVPEKEKILLSPFTSKKCVYYRYTIEEYKRQGKNSRWVIVGQGEDRSTFHIEDNTGSVLVDPKGAQIEIPADFEFSSGKGRNPPEQIKKFLTANKMSFETFLGINKSMRYREYFIAPGDKIYIMGTADDNPFVEDATAKSNAEDIMISKGKNEPFYYISDSDEKDVLKKFKWRVIGGLYGGPALSVVCLFIIMAYLGLIW